MRCINLVTLSEHHPPCRHKHGRSGKQGSAFTEGSSASSVSVGRASCTPCAEKGVVVICCSRVTSEVLVSTST